MSDKIINYIQALSTDDASDWKELKSQLEKSEGWLEKNHSQIDGILSKLDPHQHTFGFLTLLHSKSSNPNALADPSGFIHHTINLLSFAKPEQLRVDSQTIQKFKQVTQVFLNILVENKCAIRAIKPLRQAITRLQPTKWHITPQHCLFLQAAILAKHYHHATTTLPHAYQVEKNKTGVDSTDILLYLYYSGIAFAGMKDWKKAVFYFKQVISFPAVVPSRIMVEGYKKYVITSLLAYGRVGSTPKHATPSFARHFKQLCPAYEEFQTSFATNSTEDLHACARGHAEAFKKDGNLGLVKQAIHSLYARNVQRLTKTYMTLSVQDIVGEVKLRDEAEAQREVLSMIETGDIFAEMNQKDGMIVFKEDPEKYDTEDMLVELDALIHNTMTAGKELQKLDETIAKSERYVQKTLVSERGGAGGRWGGAGDYEDIGGDWGMALDRPGVGGFRG